jgi:hypothetical protein
MLSAQTIQQDSITVILDDGPIMEKGFSEDFSQKY